MTISLSRGSVRSRFLRLCSLAPLMTMERGSGIDRHSNRRITPRQGPDTGRLREVTFTRKSVSKPNMKDLIPPERIERAIFLVRGQKVLLDADLALIYDVQTKVLNQAVKRNLRRFPDDFAFQLTVAEFANLKSKIVSSSLQLIDSPADNLNRSRIVTGSQKHRDPRFLPYAFTEHGAIMAANVLNSHRAVQMSVFVVRAFVKMRGVFADTRDQARKL